jgi:dTDP-4-dehydrorhamnose 3,5-epimerase
MMMTRFAFRALELEGAYFISNFSAEDVRGGFTKTFEDTIFRQNGIDFQLTESFLSSSAKHVIRGLHFQTKKPQAKLVSVPSGSVYDVIVDLRPQSPTFKKWQGFTLSATNHNALYIPRGFAHGYLSLEDNTLLLYQCDGSYDKATDTGIRFDDTDIGIEWPVTFDHAVLSPRDLSLMSFQEYKKNPMIL